MSVISPTKPLLVPGSTARHLLGVGNTKYWQLVKSGAIETVDVAGRKMPTMESIERIAKNGAPKAAA
jgi:hypothetical protein